MVVQHHIMYLICTNEESDVSACLTPLVGGDIIVYIFQVVLKPLDSLQQAVHV